VLLLVVVVTVASGMVYHYYTDKVVTNGQYTQVIHHGKIVKILDTGTNVTEEQRQAILKEWEGK